MSDFGTSFGLLVGIPAIVFAAVSLTRRELAAYARRSLVVYAALLTVALASLAAGALGNPAIVLAALAFAYVATLTEGPISLAVSAFGLFVLLLIGMTRSVPVSVWGEALGILACLAGLVGEIGKRGNPRLPDR